MGFVGRTWDPARSEEANTRLVWSSQAKEILEKCGLKNLLNEERQEEICDASEAKDDPIQEVSPVEPVNSSTPEPDSALTAKDDGKERKLDAPETCDERDVEGSTSSC